MPRRPTHPQPGGRDSGLIVGALLGDFMRGVDPAGLPDDLAAGLALHRRVDRFADAHEAFRHSRRALFSDVGHWAGVVVDVVYDHVLARDWDRWHDEPLPVFTSRAFEAFAARDVELPEPLQRAWRRMREIDLLGSYTELDGALVALRRTVRSSKHAARMHRLEPAVTACLAGLSADFEVFYPELCAHVAHGADGAHGEGRARSEGGGHDTSHAAVPPGSGEPG